MKVEPQYKKAFTERRSPKQARNECVFIDNRPKAMVQAKLIDNIYNRSKAILPVRQERENKNSTVCQLVTQDDVENVLSDKMGIKDQITNYGGLCGGWSISLLKEKNGLEIWNQWERLYNEGNLRKENITKPMINYFKRVMRNQYVLDISDYMNYDDEQREEREGNIAILGTALEIVGGNAKPPVNYDAARYDINNYEIRDKKQLSDIKTIVIEHGSILLATDSHFMSIKKISKDKFLLSETNKTGYGIKTWTGIVNCIKKELVDNDFVVHIKMN